MLKEGSRVTQRKRGGSESAEVDVNAEQETADLTPLQLVNYYVAQYIGSVLCVIGIALLMAGYDREWMHNTHLCLLSLGLCLIGWLFHELRPFNVSVCGC